MSQTRDMGSRRFGRVNWLGLYTLAWREVMRFVSVWTQTLLAPLVTEDAQAFAAESGIEPSC